MSIPLHCPDCGELVGVGDFSAFAEFRPRCFVADVVCPGRGKHQSSVRTTERKMFGLVQRITIKYPDTSTSTSWNEYVGPKRSIYVWLALMLGNDSGIVLKGKYCYWSLELGFYGDGAEELKSA